MQFRHVIETDLDSVARVQARSMVASKYYDDSVDVESEYQRLHPRVVGYFSGVYHPSCSLPERSVIVAEHDDQIIGFIAGHRSTRMGCESELQWTSVLPNARLLRVADAAHFPYVENPRVVWPAIEEFLNGKWPSTLEAITESH